MNGKTIRRESPPSPCDVGPVLQRFLDALSDEFEDRWGGAALVCVAMMLEPMNNNALRDLNQIMDMIHSRKRVLELDA